MNEPPATDPRLASFPPALRALLDAELAAGNSITEVASCFPAPPAGAYAKLAKMISTRPRASGAGLHFRARNWPTWSGEWTDDRRFYFLLEPPLPPPPEPDMNAIRQAAAFSSGPSTPPLLPAEHATPAPPPGPASRPRPRSLVQRFEDSMAIDYEKWHDGIGYDLALIEEATREEREQIERLLLRRGVRDWRDVEALAALGTPKATAALERTLQKGTVELRGAVRRYAPGLVSAADKTRQLVTAVQEAGFYGGLTQALDEIATFHPPEVVTALLRATLEREGSVAVHFAAMLLFLHGRAAEPFDCSQRPFVLKFHAPIGAAREAVFKELCAKIGVDPAPHLRRRRA